MMLNLNANKIINIFIQQIKQNRCRYLINYTIYPGGNMYFLRSVLLLPTRELELTNLTSFDKLC